MDIIKQGNQGPKAESLDSAVAAQSREIAIRKLVELDKDYGIQLVPRQRIFTLLKSANGYTVLAKIEVSGIIYEGEDPDYLSAYENALIEFRRSTGGL